MGTTKTIRLHVVRSAEYCKKMAAETGRNFPLEVMVPLDPAKLTKQAREALLACCDAGVFDTVYYGMCVPETRYWKKEPVKCDYDLQDVGDTVPGQAASNDAHDKLSEAIVAAYRASKEGYEQRQLENDLKEAKKDDARRRLAAAAKELEAAAAEAKELGLK